jgi:DNA (cytosine-5)-methyltransferase 1
MGGDEALLNEDIRKIDKFPGAEILCGCYPCQGYSQGGARKSDKGINFLYREFDRALRAVRPTAFIVENVDGLRFAQNQSLLRAQLTRFRSAGYRVESKVLDAKDFGLAQDRRRLFLVGLRADLGSRFNFPAPTHGPGTARAYKNQRDAIWGLRDATDGTYNTEDFHWYYLSRNRWRGWAEQARCIVAHWRHVGLHPDAPPLVKVATDQWEFAWAGFARRLSYLECAALQGFPSPQAFAGLPLRATYRAIGNAVPPPLFAAVARSLAEQLGVQPRRPPAVETAVASP